MNVDNVDSLVDTPISLGTPIHTQGRHNPWPQHSPHKGTAVDLKAEQLDSATAARGSATSALKQRAPASRDHSCVPALPACSPLWRATFLIVHDLHHDQYLLALATRYRSWYRGRLFPPPTALLCPVLSGGLCQ
jgi:hypothetical protein